MKVCRFALAAAAVAVTLFGGKDCTFLPPSKRDFGIVFQSYALFPNMTVRGIRPEKIRIVNYTESHNFKTLVRDIEFKGAFTRIYSVIPQTNREIFIDVPSDSVGGMNVERDAELCLRIPDEHALNYSLCG